VYRVKQFFGALLARVDEDDEQVLARLLTPPQRELFRRMARNDQRHSLDVCATLRRAGHADPDLLAAALLHDAGKAAGRIALWQRTAIVLLKRWSPGLLGWLARGDDPTTAPWWRQGFVVNKLHPALGAQWAKRAGCSPTTVALICRHQEAIRTVHDHQDRLLATLQRADGEN
jgi:hypothetical protein